MKVRHYIKGCLIDCNIRQIEDVIFLMNWGTPGIILTVDFEKHLIQSVGNF